VWSETEEYLRLRVGVVAVEVSRVRRERTLMFFFVISRMRGSFALVWQLNCAWPHLRKPSRTPCVDGSMES
jgi:hypothetical protein